MRAHSIMMLGTGLIGDFYTATLHGQVPGSPASVNLCGWAPRGAVSTEATSSPSVWEVMVAGSRIS